MEGKKANLQGSSDVHDNYHIPISKLTGAKQPTARKVNEYNHPTIIVSHQSIPNLVVKLNYSDDTVGEVRRKNSSTPG
ncbi:hypothetical protein RJ641_031887 [Dillenia turbinata]|uniref:Uncharacterized protein n=1 Tax=Dillenia turbinata TaxID=194707 RepID=A0AAN8VQV9_9MAGN